jgi:cytochrome oxidase Cu insertion factor (SCO1/SenC/PrrC family)
MRTRLIPVLILLAAGCSFPKSRTTPTGTETTEVDPKFPVGPFSLTERSGKTVTDKDLRGTVWVASFIFTRCTGPCPAVTSTVARLQSEFKGVTGVKFVTFTVDPARDDLSSLREYANSRNADPEKWLFLTGDEAVIHKLLREQFKTAVGRKTDPGVKPGDEFAHSTKLMVVDREGVIRGIYAGLPDENSPTADEDFKANLDRLKARVNELLK